MTSGNWSSVVLTKLSFMSDKNPTAVEGLIMFELLKFASIAPVGLFLRSSSFKIFSSVFLFSFLSMPVGRATRHRVDNESSHCDGESIVEPLQIGY